MERTNEGSMEPEEINEEEEELEEEEEIEMPLKFNMTTKKMIFVDVLILAVIICAFLGGLWQGQRMEHTKVTAFYDGYLDSCVCDVPLQTMANGKLFYERSALFANKKDYQRYGG